MDQKPVPYTGGVPERQAPPEYCAYCGARLDPFYYFCPVCATPYKKVESVLPALRVAPPTDGQLIEKKAPHVTTVFWTYFAVVVGSAVLCFLMFEDDRLALRLLVQTVLLFVTTCVFASMHWPSLVVQFKRFGFGKPAALYGLLALVPVLAINYGYHGWIIRELGGERALPFDRLRESGLGEPALILFFCVFPAILEEIAFRGLVQHWLQIAIRPLRAMVLASFLFMVLHFSIISAPYLFGVGMLLGWVRWKTGSLYPSILIHFLHNLIVLEFFWR